MTAFADGDLLAQRMAALLVLDRRLPSPPPAWIGEHLSPVLPPRTATVARTVAAGVRTNRRRSGFALASIRRTLAAEQRELSSADLPARSRHSAEAWVSPDSPVVQDWFRALAWADRLWLLAVQQAMADLAPALLPMLGVFAAPRQPGSLPPGVTAFMPATPAPAAIVAAVQRALFQDRPPGQAPAHHVLRQWIQALNDPTLARAVTCALVLVNAGTISIRTCTLADAVQTIEQRIQPGQRHLLVQACRWRLQEPKAADQPGRRAQLYGGYLTRSFGTTPLLDRREEPRLRPQTGKSVMSGPIPHVIDQLTQVDLLARHARSYTLTDQHGVQTGAVVPTPRWLFEESHADPIAATASGSRIQATETRWVAKMVLAADRPAQSPGWAPVPATLIDYHRTGVFLVRDGRPPRRPGRVRQAVVGTVAAADLLARSHAELLLAQDIQAVALFDYRLGVTVPGDGTTIQRRHSRSKA